MKNRIKRAITVVAVAIIFLLILNGLIMYTLYKFGGTDIETRKFNMLISGMKEINPDSELPYALQWYGNWDNMFLTENFKKKFKNRKGILKNVNSLENISGYIDYEYKFGETLIGISGFKRKNLLEMLDPDYIEIDKVYYFRYKVDENGYLDDVELVGQQDFDALTGFPIGIDDSKYHTIS